MSKKTIILIISILASSGISHASEICSTYQRPDIKTKQEFQNTNYGTLGLKYVGDRFLAFNNTGCFDIFEHKNGTNVNFFVNSTQDTLESTYLTAAVSWLSGTDMADVPPVALNLYRNETKNDDNASWVRAFIDEEKHKSGTIILGGKIDLIKSEFDSLDEIDVNSFGGYDQFDFTSLPEASFGWHALLVDINKQPSLHRPYRIIKNTRDRVNSIRSSIMQLPQNKKHTISKIYLIKYRTSTNPSFAKAHLSFKARGCIYIDYRVDAEESIPINQNNEIDFLVLRFDKNTKC